MDACAHMPLTDNYEEPYTSARLPTLEHDLEYVLESGNIPLSSDSTHTVSIKGGDAVVKLKIAKSDRYHITVTRTIIDEIVC